MADVKTQRLLAICLSALSLLQRRSCTAEQSISLSPSSTPSRRPANPRNLTVYHVVDTRFQPPIGSPEREWPIDMDTVRRLCVLLDFVLCLLLCGMARERATHSALSRAVAAGGLGRRHVL